MALTEKPNIDIQHVATARLMKTDLLTEPTETACFSAALYLEIFNVAGLSGVLNLDQVIENAEKIRAYLKPRSE